VPTVSPHQHYLVAPQGTMIPVRRDARRV